MSRLEIWAATPTPFDADGRLDLPVIAEQAARLREHGTYGAFVTGTTGEFASMTTDERKRVVEAWANVRPDGFGLGAHVGSTDLAQARELATHAQDHGVDLIASVTPYYGQAPTADLAVRHLEAVAAAAPETPFCFYHIPSMTGSTLRPSEVAEVAAERIPTLRGIKYTDEDLMEFDRLRTRFPDVRVYFGRDELLPAGLAFGADAAIGSLFNGLTPLARQVETAFLQGEHERAFELHQPFRTIATVSERHGGLGFIKELMGRLGPGAGAPRTPWGPLDPADLAAADELVPALRDAVKNALAAERSPA